jgi:hypothetical protein
MLGTKEDKRDPQKLIGGTIGVASFTVLGIWLVFFVDLSNRPGRFWLACLCLAFFVFLTLYSVVTLLQNKTWALKLSSNGVLLSTFGGPLFVPWSKIEKIGATELGSKDPIILEMSEGVFSGLQKNIGQRIHFWLVRDPKLRGLPLPTDLVAASYHEVKSELEHYLQVSQAGNRDYDGIALEPSP